METRKGRGPLYFFLRIYAHGRKCITLSFRLCLQRVYHNAARRAGSSATADICLFYLPPGQQKATKERKDAMLQFNLRAL